jgi:cyclopropane-fatty-acyl-phospholipid synthase
MNTTTAPLFSLPSDTPVAARKLFSLLQRIRYGTLTVQCPDGSSHQFGAGEGMHGTLILRNWRPCAAALKSGDIGFAEAYLEGDWASPSLVDLLRVLVANRREMEDLVYGHWLGRLAYRVRHWMNRNTRRNSAKNIHAHYDLGNPFYALWLDPTMNYSSAWFDGDTGQSLAQAQHAKMARALRMAGVMPGAAQRVLEIGCGWGALAEMGAATLGAQMTGVTLSQAQLDFAQHRLQSKGLQADLRLQDYRDIQDPPYDAICSIEMLEAVGQAYWPQYFATLNRLLKPGGRACIQTIVIEDGLFERYIRGTDFIQQYIFPGGCLPCPQEFVKQAQAAGLEVRDTHSFGHDYAETLRRWREQFLHEKSQVLQLNFDDRFIRTWEFYLAYCEAAFWERNTDVVQYTLLKPWKA